MQNQHEASLDKIKDSAEEQEKYFNIMVHDIKNPLFIIQSYISILQRKFPKSEISEATKIFNTLNKHCERINKTIVQNFELNEIKNRDKSSSHKLNLVTEIEEILSQYKMNLNHRRI